MTALHVCHKGPLLRPFAFSACVGESNGFILRTVVNQTEQRKMLRTLAFIIAALVLLYGTTPGAYAATMTSTTTINGVTYQTVMVTDGAGHININTHTLTRTEVNQLYKQLDMQCRGGSGDASATQAACQQRDAL